MGDGHFFSFPEGILKGKGVSAIFDVHRSLDINSISHAQAHFTCSTILSYTITRVPSFSLGERWWPLEF